MGHFAFTESQLAGSAGAEEPELNEAEEDAQADEWEVVAKSNTARRHKVQKEAKRAQREAMTQVMTGAAA